jgi:hypothetical protein
MSLRLTSSVQDDQTRLCFDPWSFVQIQSNGNVLPCCVHSPVGRLSTGFTLERILTGEAVRKIRFSLLSGQLDSECLACQNRSAVDVAEFRREHMRKYFLSGKTLDCSGNVDLESHPELARIVQFSNVNKGFYGLGDRVYLHPAPGKRPTVRFKNLLIREPSDLDLFLYLDHAESPNVRFQVNFVERNRFNFLRPNRRHTRLISGKTRQHWRISCPIINREFDLVCSTSARKYDYAWLYFSYPFFIARENQITTQRIVEITSKGS